MPSVFSSKNGILWKKQQKTISSACNSNTSHFSQTTLRKQKSHFVRLKGQVIKSWNEMKALICMDSSRTLKWKWHFFKISNAWQQRQGLRVQLTTTSFWFVKMSAALSIIISVNIKNSEKGKKKYLNISMKSFDLIDPH